jgi:hypothetical protein
MLFGVVASCGGGVEVENPTLEHGVTDVNQAWKCFGITQDQRCNRRFNFGSVCQLLKTLGYCAVLVMPVIAEDIDCLTCSTPNSSDRGQF